MNTLTIIRCSIGTFAGLLYSNEVFSKPGEPKSGIIILKNPIALEINMVPQPGAIQGSIALIPQWIGYSLWTPELTLNISSDFFSYDLDLDSDNFVVNIYKRTLENAKKQSPNQKLH